MVTVAVSRLLFPPRFTPLDQDEAEDVFLSVFVVPPPSWSNGVIGGEISRRDTLLDSPDPYPPFDES